MRPLQFDVAKTCGAARLGVLRAGGNIIKTPVFMPVGTLGAVKAVSPADLSGAGTRILLSNAYHLYLRPGIDVIQSAGGLHSFMRWEESILTDSGGFQVFSLADFVKVDDDGVSFKSHVDGSSHRFTPESVVDIQLALGSDIMMVLDHCTKVPCPHGEALAAVNRTTAWARRSLARLGPVRQENRLFGIVQGNVYMDLREKSAKELVDMGFPGFGIGGLSVGEDRETMLAVLEGTTKLLPEEKPRYLMGVGDPRDIVRCVERGVDMFDCVLPTRNARNATVLTRRGPLSLRNARYRTDNAPIDEFCGCDACRGGFSRAYLRHLFSVNEILAHRFATIHNIRFVNELMNGIRKTIGDGTFDTFSRAFLSGYAGGSH